MDLWSSYHCVLSDIITRYCTMLSIGLLPDTPIGCQSFSLILLIIFFIFLFSSSYVNTTLAPMYPSIISCRYLSELSECLKNFQCLEVHWGPCNNRTHIHLEKVSLFWKTVKIHDDWLCINPHWCCFKCPYEIFQYVTRPHQLHIPLLKYSEPLFYQELLFRCWEPNSKMYCLSCVTHQSNFQSWGYSSHVGYTNAIMDHNIQNLLTCWCR